MSVKILDGTGSKNRVAVFDNRMREIEIQQSATNHISTSILGERTGVFTVSNSRKSNFNFTTSCTACKQVLISITNNDPINLMVIDSMYISIIFTGSGGPVLPDKGILVAVDNRSGTGTIPIINENKFSTIRPLVTARDTGSAQSVVAPLTINNTLRAFPTLGDVIELISSNSDAIIVPGLPINVTDTNSANTISIAMFMSGQSATFNPLYNTFIRFIMVPPDQLG